MVKGIGYSFRYFFVTCILSLKKCWFSLQAHLLIAWLVWSLLFNFCDSLCILDTNPPAWYIVGREAVSSFWWLFPWLYRILNFMSCHLSYQLLGLFPVLWKSWLESPYLCQDLEEFYETCSNFEVSGLWPIWVGICAEWQTWVVGFPKSVCWRGLFSTYIFLTHAGLERWLSGQGHTVCSSKGLGFDSRHLYHSQI